LIDSVFAGGMPSDPSKQLGDHVLDATLDLMEIDLFVSV
jgi:hypothetical protein